MKRFEGMISYLLAEGPLAQFCKKCTCTFIVKAGCEMTDAREKFSQNTIIESLALISLALIGVVAQELNQLRRDQLKRCFPLKIQPLAKNDPTNSKWLFGNDLTKQISLLENKYTSKALLKTSSSVNELKISSFPRGAPFKGKNGKSRTINTTQVGLGR